MRRHRTPLRRQLPPEFFDTDEAMRLMVATLVINSHPEGVSFADLVYELSADANDSSVERALRACADMGLLRREGRLVFSTLPPDIRISPPPERPGCPGGPRQRGDH